MVGFASNIVYIHERWERVNCHSFTLLNFFIHRDTFGAAVVPSHVGLCFPAWGQTYRNGRHLSAPLTRNQGR